MQAQFASRPTLRQVAAQQLLELLVRHYPLIATAYPELDSAEGLSLFIAPQGLAPGRFVPLTTVFIEAFQRGSALALTRDQWLSMEPPRRFDATDVVTEDLSPEDVLLNLEAMNPDLNQLLKDLVAHFQQAQVDYWNKVQDSAPDEQGVNRHLWVQQALRMALLGNLRSQALADDVRACLYELLSGRVDGMQIQAVEATMRGAQGNRSIMLPDLLVSLERDEEQHLLWCRPSGDVRVYTSAEAFGVALRDVMAREQRFESLSWNTYELQGNAFMQQSALLLSWMLARLDHVRWSSLDGVEQVEAVCAQLSDPAEVFFEATYFDDSGAVPALPDWLSGASSQDRFEYQVAMLDLALDQALSGGASSLEGLLDLQDYSRQRLREQLLADYPVEANYFPDDLLLTLQSTEGVPGGMGVGPGDGLVTRRTMTLTQFAIGNLSSLGHSTIVDITHRDDQEIMAWLTPRYLKDLVEKVDVGGRYPAYVQGTLDDARTRDVRVKRFSREWRNQLLFEALKLKIEGGLSAKSWQALAEFCRGNRDLKSNVNIAPLAFRVPGIRAGDVVTCMFVIHFTFPGTWLLYRPLQGVGALREFCDDTALMVAISEEDDLQRSVLAWIEPDARTVYEHGGFKRPHLIGGWTEGVAEALTPGLSVVHSAAVAPAGLSFSPWLADIDANLFAAKAQALGVLGKRDSVSTAQSRWQHLKEGAWLLFNVVAPLLQGPVASVTWLVLAVDALKEDVEALRQGSDAEKSLAIMDLVSSVSMVLLHGSMAKAVRPKVEVEFTGKNEIPVSDVVVSPAVEPVEKGRVYLSDSLQDRNIGAVSLASGWGPGPASERKALQRFATTVDLAGVAADGEGFYVLGEQRYVELYGERFQVRRMGDNVRIVGPDGREGPYLWRGEQWKIRIGFFGGMPSGRSSASARQREVDRFVRQVAENTASNSAVNARLEELAPRINALYGQLDVHQNGLASARQNADGKLSQEQVGRLSDFHRGQITIKTREWQELLGQAVAQRERSVGYLRGSLALLDRISEAQRFLAASNGISPENLTSNRLTGRIGVVLNSWRIFDELRQLVDYPRLKKVMSALEGRRVQDVVEDYRELTTHLQNAVQMQERMIQASIDLDRYLPELQPDVVLFDAPEPYTVAKVAASRNLTTARVRFHQALNYLNLALPLDNVEQLGKSKRYAAQLGCDALKRAASAHAQLPRAKLSASDQIEILQNAWDEYSAAIGNSLDIAAAGGAAVKLDMLDGYRKHLQALKDMAGEQLVQAIAEQDGAKAPALGAAYARSSMQQHAVRTLEGELVVATEQKEGSLTFLEVRNPFTDERLHRFELVDGVWKEIVAQAPVPGESAPASETRARAEALLAEDEIVASMAMQYVARDVRDRELTRLLDGHQAALAEAADGLAALDDVKDLVARLNERMAHWTARAPQLLSELYLKTRFPGARALSFLHQRQLIKVEYVGPRKRIRNGSAMDEYMIKRLKTPEDSEGEPLWVAHFHFADEDAPANDFARGHLKTMRQRYYGRRDAALLAQSGERIHRGGITFEQVKGIIPFGEGVAANQS